MAGLKPIGSEKLQGMDKIRRMIQISRYNENIPQNINETNSSEYKITLADGNTYEIVKERQGYIVKMSINESVSDYIEPMTSRKYYSSYSQALKRLNLMTKEINTLFENEEGTPLLGEQKKKFILKTKKPKEVETPAAETPAPEVAAAPETPPTPPMPEAGGEPTAEPPMPEMGGGETPGMEPPMPEMGGGETPGMEPPMPEMNAEPDMEPPMPEMNAEPDMEPPMPEMGGGEMPDMGFEEEEEIDVEKKPKEKKVSDLKRIQILTGKLAQKIRSYEEDKELDPKDVKYIINSILSAIDVDVLDEDDIEQIINKLEGVEDEEGGSEEEVGVEETEVVPEPPQEPEMAEGYNSLGDAFVNKFMGAYTAGSSNKLTAEEDSFNEENDEYYRDRRKGRKHYPNVDRFEHGTFSESAVDRVLSRYFVFNEAEDLENQKRKERRTSDLYKKNKENIVRLSESTEQLDIALDFIRENPRTKLIGISTKGNLVFKEGLTETKITKSGKIL
jgi:hypothetical protein